MRSSPSYILQRRSVTWLSVLTLLGATAACNDDSTTPGAGSPAAILQLIDAAPRYPSVNFYVNSTLATVGQAYGDNTVFLYAPASPVPQTFGVRSSTDTTLLASTQAILGVDTLYTVVFTQHSVNGGVIVLPDTVSAPLATNAEFRIVNAAPSAGGAVDVYETGVSASLIGATPVASNVAFEGSSLYIPFTAGTVRIRVTAVGTQNVLLDLNPVTLTAGQVRTVILLDAVGGGTPLTFVVLQDRG
jgi:hypothetical protein